MAALPYIQLYTADYLADTAHLSTIEHGAYLLLIFNYWQRGESFKAKDEQTLNKRLASVARVSENEWEIIKENVLEYFEISITGNGIELTHKRIDADLNAVIEKSNKASQAGKASAASRNNKRLTSVEQTLNHTDTDTDTDTEIHPHKKHEDVGEKSPRSQKKFIEPSFEDVLFHMKTKIQDSTTAGREADKFINFYNSKGWVVGKTKMKDWKSACNGWVSRNYETQARDSPAKPTNGLHDGFAQKDYTAGINPDGSF